MREDYKKYRNISLSIIIKRDLKQLKMTQKSLAAQIGMSYNHLNYLINTGCKFTSKSERLIENILGYEIFFIRNLRDLQSQCKNKEEALRKQYAGREIPAIRKCVFWDINPDNLDWTRHRKFIIARVSQYGNDQEKKDITAFYNL